jgi:hypothetical protein
LIGIKITPRMPFCAARAVLLRRTKSEYGPELTSRDVRDLVAIERKADMTPTSPEDRV